MLGWVPGCGNVGSKLSVLLRVELPETTEREEIVHTRICMCVHGLLAVEMRFPAWRGACHAKRERERERERERSRPLTGLSRVIINKLIQRSRYPVQSILLAPNRTVVYVPLNAIYMNMVTRLARSSITVGATSVNSATQSTAVQTLP